MGELDGPAKDYLGKLGVELSARGMVCELVTSGWVPRLRLETPGYRVGGRHIDSAFEDHVIAAAFGDGQLSFARSMGPGCCHDLGTTLRLPDHLGVADRFRQAGVITGRCLRR